MKTILSTLLIIIRTNTLGQAQEKEYALKQPDEVLIPKDFFNSENYIPSCDYDSICIPYRWLSLVGDYDNCITSIGGFRFGTYIEFGADGRFCVFRGVGHFQKPPIVDVCGNYILDSSNGLLYMHWEKSNNPLLNLRDIAIVCKICYFKSKDSGTRYKEILQLSRYIGATWDMPLEVIEMCQTTPLFETFVRYDNHGVVGF